MFDFSSDPYRNLSAVYDVFGLSRFSLTAVETVLETLVGTKPGQSLDLGCGTGKAVFRLAQEGWKAAGMDNCPQMLSLARLNALEAQAQVDFIRGDLREIPEGKKVNLLTCFATLNHFEPSTLVRVLSRMSAMLSLDGYLAFDLITPEGAVRLPSSEARVERDLYLLRLRSLRQETGQLSTRWVWFKGRSGNYEKQETTIVEYPVSLESIWKTLLSSGLEKAASWRVDDENLTPAEEGERILILAKKRLSHD